jgi:hypothetical protein
MDADVRLQPDGLRRTCAFLQSSAADLVSGVPHQTTVTLLEKLLVPLIHVILLGFLPLGRMRASRHPAYGAGCGQFFAARREAYQRCGGHRAIKKTLHDGIRLPRAFRAANLPTDLFDATDVASCRMYHSSAEVWRGFGKNAVEGLAAPAMIVPASILLGGGQIMPPVLCVLGAAGLIAPVPWAIAIAACILAYLPRLAAASRFRQSLLGAGLHPLGVALFLLIQWQALIRWLLGGRVSWRGRTYAA